MSGGTMFHILIYYVPYSYLLNRNRVGGGGGERRGGGGRRRGDCGPSATSCIFSLLLLRGGGDCGPTATSCIFSLLLLLVMISVFSVKSSHEKSSLF